MIIQNNIQPHDFYSHVHMKFPCTYIRTMADLLAYRTEFMSLTNIPSENCNDVTVPTRQIYSYALYLSSPIINNNILDLNQIKCETSSYY